MKWSQMSEEQKKEQLEKMRKSFRRSFIAAAAVTTLSAGFMVAAEYNTRDGGAWDMNQMVNEETIAAYMENNPDIGPLQARDQLLDIADENEETIRSFGRINTALMLGMTGMLYFSQRRKKQKQENPPKP